MNFKDATNALFGSVGHADLAKQLGVSVQAVRQARADPASAAFREPPKGWREAIIRLAEVRALHYRKLIEDMREGL